MFCVDRCTTFGLEPTLEDAGELVGGVLFTSSGAAVTDWGERRGCRKHTSRFYLNCTSIDGLKPVSLQKKNTAEKTVTGFFQDALTSS
jgi:hypothetical protein